MGLDMYLEAKKYVGEWGRDGDDAEFADIMTAIGLGGFKCEGSPSVNVSVTVAYWRKANAIHQWFVDNVQDGEDECEAHDVEREQLVELRDLCKRLLAELKTEPGDVYVGTSFGPGGKEQRMTRPGIVVSNPELAAELLPSQSGFFFGGTDYDEWYIAALSDTVKQLDAVLNDPRFADFCFEYRSSW